jgi:hypothetical protein
MAGRGSKMENYYTIARLDIQEAVTRLILTFLEYYDNNDQSAWPNLFAEHGTLELQAEGGLYAAGNHEIRELGNMWQSGTRHMHVASNIKVDPGMDTISASAKAYITKYVGDEGGQGSPVSVGELNVTALRDEGGSWKIEHLSETVTFALAPAKSRL